MKKITYNAVFTVLAMAIAYFERFIPLQLVIPLPGIKLGLANIVTMFLLFYSDIPSALTVITLRCILSSLLFGNIISLIFSFSGGIASLFIMAMLKRLNGKFITLYGISMAGAAAHNFGQIIAASITLYDTAVFGYLPFLLLASIITGLITGAFSNIIFSRLSKPDLTNIMERTLWK